MQPELSCRSRSRQRGVCSYTWGIEGGLVRGTVLRYGMRECLAWCGQKDARVATS